MYCTVRQWKDYFAHQKCYLILILFCHDNNNDKRDTYEENFVTFYILLNQNSKNAAIKTSWFNTNLWIQWYRWYHNIMMPTMTLLTLCIWWQKTFYNRDIFCLFIDVNLFAFDFCVVKKKMIKILSNYVVKGKLSINKNFQLWLLIWEHLLYFWRCDYLRAIHSISLSGQCGKNSKYRTIWSIVAAKTIIIRC